MSKQMFWRVGCSPKVAVCLVGLMASLWLSNSPWFSNQCVAQVEETTKTFVSEGVTARVGGYRPIRAEMDQTREISERIPMDVLDPKFGLIVFGDQSWGFVLDEPEEGAPRLFVDTNGDKDFTNDPETTWTPRQTGDLTMYSGSARVDLGEEELGLVNLYRFDPNDPRREALKNTMLYYSDFGFEFTFDLDGESYSTFVAGKLTDSGSLPIDRDDNGKISSNYERVAIGEPFNFTGTTYVFLAVDGELTLSLATESLEQMSLPPNLEVGQPALEFTATTMSGDEINFPKDFSGRLVMLDFWATWCGPCIAEIPNMKAAYDEYHDDGFEILGVSFDNEGMEDAVKEFLTERELPWPQIYEGKGWNTTLGEMHDVSAIPFVLLVDGDSGEILATARQLRGPGLAEFIGQQLEARNERSNDE